LISILRSNQPIAWFIVPLTLFAGLLARGWVLESTWESLSIQGGGLIFVAMLCHHIYVKGHFVERGDPALGWCVIAWGLIFLEVTGPWMDQLLFWLSLLIACASLSLTLRMHRQPTTSAIQFRAGALAAVAIYLNPELWGIAVGLILIQINTRPAIFREWMMLTIGAVWGGLGAFFVAALLNPTSGPTAFVHPSVLGDVFLFGGTVAWGAFGFIVLMKEQSNKNLRMQNARINSVLFTGSLVAGSCISWGLQIPLEAVFRAPPASPALALPLAFLTVNLIPQWEHHKRNSNRLTNGLFWLFVGTLLVLFTHQIIP